MEVALLGVGFSIGCIVTMIIFRLFLVGTLRIDTSDPDDVPYMFLELSKGVDAISSKKYVILRVNINNFISHK